MRYFFDTEFIEGFTKPWVGKPLHFIQLISIGIVAEDGRIYYAISNEFNYNRADEWVKKNVIAKLQYKGEVRSNPTFFNTSYQEVYDGMEAVKKIGKSNKQIAKEIIEFINPQLAKPADMYSYKDIAIGSEMHKHFTKHNVNSFNVLGSGTYYYAQPEFWAYFSDYDWVVFCSLFGKMITLPPGFPKVCYDLKQFMDSAGLNKEWKKKTCPEPEDAHNALADAKWNQQLFTAVTTEKILQLQQWAADIKTQLKGNNSLLLVPHKSDCQAMEWIKDPAAPTEWNVLHLEEAWCDRKGHTLTEEQIIEAGGSHLFYELKCGDPDCPGIKRIKASDIGNM